MHPLQGASFLGTPLQGGILKPPALRVVDDCFTPPVIAYSNASFQPVCMRVSGLYTVKVLHTQGLMNTHLAL